MSDILDILKAVRYELDQVRIDMATLAAERDALRLDAERYRKLKTAGPTAARWLAMTPDSSRWDESIDEHLQGDEV